MVMTDSTMTAAQNETPDEGARSELYLVTPVISDAAQFLPRLEPVLRACPVAAIRLRLAPGPREVQAGVIEALRGPIQEQGVALMLDGLPALARATGCDGAHVDASDVVAARKALGDDLQLGAFCGMSRDLAMQAGMEGADYVSFGAFSETSDAEAVALLRWWTEVMELPAVAEYVVSGTESEGTAVADRLMRTADFVAVGTEEDGAEAAGGVWDAPFTLLRTIGAASQGLLS